MAGRPKRKSVSDSASQLGSAIVYFLGEKNAEVFDFCDLRKLAEEPLDTFALRQICEARWTDGKWYRCIIVLVDEARSKKELNTYLSNGDTLVSLCETGDRWALDAGIDTKHELEIVTRTKRSDSAKRPANRRQGSTAPEARLSAPGIPPNGSISSSQAGSTIHTIAPATSALSYPAAASPSSAPVTSASSPHAASVASYITPPSSTHSYPTQIASGSSEYAAFVHQTEGQCIPAQTNPPHIGSGPSYPHNPYPNDNAHGPQAHRSYSTHPFTPYNQPYHHPNHHVSTYYPTQQAEARFQQGDEPWTPQIQALRSEVTNMRQDLTELKAIAQELAALQGKLSQQLQGQGAAAEEAEQIAINGHKKSEVQRKMLGETSWKKAVRAGFSMVFTHDEKVTCVATAAGSKRTEKKVPKPELPKETKLMLKGCLDVWLVKNKIDEVISDTLFEDCLGSCASDYRKVINKENKTM